MENCANCRFGQLLIIGIGGGYSDDGVHLCRRHAPRPVLPAENTDVSDADDCINQAFALWPSVYDDQWCGDYEAATITSQTPGMKSQRYSGQSG